VAGTKADRNEAIARQACFVLGRTRRRVPAGICRVPYSQGSRPGEENTRVGRRLVLRTEPQNRVRKRSSRLTISWMRTP
jgi:hypothetical protein